MNDINRNLISVIVPVYNAEKYLDRCLTSLISQTHKELEIILVNDGSADTSAELCRNWCGKDARIKLIHQENQGVSAARNLGLENASGNYIVFVDADDWIKPLMLEKQLKCLKKEHSDIVLSGFCEVDGEKSDNGADKQQKIENSEYSEKTVDSRTYAGEYLLRGNNRCWSVLFKREAIGQVRFIKGLTIGEDLLFMIDILPQIRRISVLEDQDYCYFINENGAMMAEFREKYMDQVRCWELAAERMENMWPEYIPLIQVCLFQAALLVAGKLAMVPDLKAEGIQEYLNCCSRAARKSWKVLGRNGRKLLSKGYKAKGLVFLGTPKLYLKMYHVWKGMK